MTGRSLLRKPKAGVTQPSTGKSTRAQLARRARHARPAEAAAPAVAKPAAQGRARPATDPSARNRKPPTQCSNRAPAPAGRANPVPARPPAPVVLPGPAVENTGKVRISKLMAERGLCSRREADEYIERGWVYVDGECVTQLGARALPSQTITLDKRADSVSKVTILLHKPVGYVSGQAEDGYKPAVMLVTPANQNKYAEGRFAREHLWGLAPAGRLDIDSTGLLVFTQDGRIARQLIGEDSEVDKEYLVRVEGNLDDAGLRLLNHGLSLDEVALKPAQVAWQNKDQLRFILREGRKRQIRRMCELVGLNVTALKRIRIGRVDLGELPPGQWRYLRADEKF